MTAQTGLQPDTHGDGTRLGRARSGERRRGRAFELSLLSCLGFGVLVLAVLLYDVIHDGASRFNLDLIREMPSGRALDAGIQSAMMGTIWVIVTVAVITVPLGVATAVYLEEYADRTRWYNRAIELNIQNLAAVPSVVYGILGLAFFARGPLDLGGSVLPSR